MTSYNTERSFSNHFFSKEVILLNSDGSFMGRMYFRKAQDMAAEQGLDLVEVAKQQDLSVCKILDRGKWLYEQKKKEKEKHQQQKAGQIQQKEIQFSMRIEKHDEQTKVKHITEILEKGNEVRIVVEMKGREKAHPNLAVEKLNSILAMFPHEKRVDSFKKTSNNVTVVVAPKRKNNDGQNTTEKGEHNRSIHKTA